MNDNLSPDSFSRAARARLAILGMACASVFAACGGGGDDGPSPTPPAPAPSTPQRAAQTQLSGTALGTMHWQNGDTATGGQGQTVAGLSCGLMDETYHVHTHLSIFLNGDMLRVPSDIGIVPATSTRAGCTYATHTHDATGKIHVEAPAPGRFTLGQFFEVWGQPLGYDNVAGLTGEPIVVYVSDGSTVTQYTGDLAEIDLTSHREITIQVGSPISEIPNYTWAGQ